MKKTLLLNLALMLCGATTFAQTTVSGTVVDTKGVPMPGAKVQVKGTNEYTITNMDGTFNIELNKPKSKLVADYVGWQTTSKGAKDGMVIKMGKRSWWKEKPTKYQWFVGANVAIPDSRMFSNMSPGLMFGGLKRAGWYVKGQYNGATHDHDCYASFTGITKAEYFSFSAGLIIRLGCPIHLYMGSGWAKYNLLDEHVCGGYSIRHESIYRTEVYEGESSKGPVVDAGLMFRVKHFFLHAGLQGIILGENIAGNFGLGYIF